MPPLRAVQIMKIMKTSVHKAGAVNNPRFLQRIRNTFATWITKQFIIKNEPANTIRFTKSLKDKPICNN